MQASSIDLVVALYKFVILLFSISAHQCAQAWMASRVGDHTARLEGRVTLNPIRHIDPIGTLLFPGLMIFGPLLGIPWFGGGVVMGWGKQVPIITRNLKKITRDDNLITLAGPLAFLLLVFFSLLLLIVIILAVPGGRDAVRDAITGQVLIGVASIPEAVAMLGWLMIEVNLGLFFFNLIPIPPLDASRVVRNMLPYNALNTFDTIGRFGVIVIFIVGGFIVRLFLGPALNLVIAVLAPFYPSH